MVSQREIVCVCVCVCAFLWLWRGSEGFGVGSRGRLARVTSRSRRRGSDPSFLALQFKTSRHYRNVQPSARSTQVHQVFFLSLSLSLKVLCRSARLFNSNLNKLAGRERAAEDSAADDCGGLWFGFERKRLDLKTGCPEHHGRSASVCVCVCVY